MLVVCVTLEVFGSWAWQMEITPGLPVVAVESWLFKPNLFGEMRTGKKILSSLVIAAATTVTITGTIKTKVLLSE